MINIDHDIIYSQYTSTMIIPKIIHQIWIGPKKRPDRFMNTWSINYIEKNPEYKYVLWDDKSVENILKFNHKVRKVFDAEPSWHGKSDIVRHLILYYYGGVYIDSDSVWINEKSLDPLLELPGDADFFISYEPNRTWFTGGVIGAVQFSVKTEFMLNMLVKMGETFSRERLMGEPWMLTGVFFVNLLNGKYSSHKFAHVYYSESGIPQIKLYEHIAEAMESMINIRYSAILYDICNDLIIDYHGNEEHCNICIKYVKQIYSIAVIDYPTHYFYPRDWFNINDPELHTKMELPSDSYMFHYGITTNEGKLDY